MEKQKKKKDKDVKKKEYENVKKDKKKDKRKDKGKKSKGIDFVKLVTHEAEKAGFQVHAAVEIYDLFPRVGADVLDETALPLISIDNDDTMDIDQLSCARQVGENIEVHVAIADVASYVKRGSPTDVRAGHNTTTLYLYVKNFWMIPERLCTDETSLAPGEKRLSVITRFLVSPSGKIVESKIWRGYVVNKHKLAYNAVSAWLDGKGPLDVPQDVKDQLRLHATVSQWLGAHRRAKGSLPFRTAKAEPIIVKKQPVGVKPVPPNNVAQDIIQYLMIATNHLCVKFVNSHGAPALRRIVKTPKQWSRLVDLAKQHSFPLGSDVDVKELQRFLEVQGKKMDEERYKDLCMQVIRLMGRGEYSVDDGTEGHFALATLNYTHSTAPNRRYPDLINQRMVMAILAGEKQLPYSKEELAAIATQCSNMEDASNKLERTVSKMLIAQVLARDKIGTEFAATICGLRKEKQQVWVRIVKGDFAGVEGRLLSSDFDAYHMGDLLNVKLVAARPKEGFIDFNAA